MVARPKGEQPESLVEWLENELRETKARLHKVESELEQALKHVWSLDADVHKLTENLSLAGSVNAALSGFREDVRQFQDQLSRVQDRQSSLANRVEEVARQKKAEAGRDKQEMAALTKQTAALERAVEHYDQRLKAMEEIARHLEEGIAGARLADQGIERAMEEMATRAARTHEAALRLDQEFVRTSGELDKLRKGDDELQDRLRLLQEQVRRASERLDKLEVAAAFPDEARELLQRAAFEREQMAQRLAAVERLAGEVSEKMQEFIQGLARLDQRTQHQAGELLALDAQLQEAAEQSRNAFKKVYQTMIRHRRRQSEALSQEIKELSQGELHSGD